MANQVISGMTVDEMLKLRRNGITLREIGEMVGVSRQRIQQLLGKTRNLKPQKVKPAPKTIEEKFWQRVDISGPNDCWEWRGVQHPITGYGSFRFCGRQTYAHRVAYILTYGEIPDGACILHSCDRPGCVNPHHMRIGTQKDNIADRDQRKRHKCRSGPNKYYVWRNQYILDHYQTTKDARGLADKFGVSCQSIYKVYLRARKELDNVHAT